MSKSLDSKKNVKKIAFLSKKVKKAAKLAKKAKRTYFKLLLNLKPR